MARGASLYQSVVRDTTGYLLYILLIATIGPFQFGFHLAELNAPQNVITCEKESIGATAANASLPHCIQMTTGQFAIITSLFTIGGFFGALSGGPACNKYGRLWTMRLISIFFVIGPLIESLAANIGVFCLGRFLSGIGAGAATVVVPIYISEVAPPDEKGLFGALTQTMINVGILTAQLLGYFLSKGNMWRIILAVAGGFGLAQFLGLFLVPESPKWLAEQRRPQLARKILQKIRGGGANLEEEIKAWNVDSSETDIEEEEGLLTASPGSHPILNPRASKESIGILHALIEPEYRPAIIAVIAVMVAQQLTGINSIVMYSVDLLSALLPTSASLLIVAVAVLNVFITALCAPLSDKIGRKTCILLSIAGMGTNSVLLALGIQYKVKILSAVATLLFVASFAVGLGPVPFILANELVGPEAVGATQSWALAANWIATFLVSQFFPIINRALGKGRVYYVFAGFALLFGSFIAWWVPETRGKHGAEEVWGKKEARGRVE